MKVIMYPGISLDGFVAKLDYDDSWISDEDNDRYEERVNEAGCLLVGRKTYELFQDWFDNFGNGKVIVFVCTTGSKYKDKERVKFIRGSAEEIIKQIEKYNFDELIVCGGGEINGLVAAAGLVDEIIVSVQPIVLGAGIPLFGSYKPELKLEVLSFNEDIKGIVQNHYRVVKD